MTRFVALLAALALTACATAPAQSAASLAEVEQSATLATDAAKAVVDTGKLTPAQLAKVSALSDALHAAVDSLEADHAADRPLNFAAFNAAYAAWASYSATLPH